MNNPTLENEVREMRATIARLQADVANLGARQPNLLFPKYVRPAITWSEEEDEENPTNYPATTEVNSFPFKFCDGEFSPRTALVDGSAYYARGIHIPRETKIIVLESKAKFLIVEAFIPCDHILTTVATAFSTGDLSLTYEDYFTTSGGTYPHPLNGQLPANINTQIVKNLFEWPGEPGWLAELEFDHKNQEWFLAQIYCDLS